MNLSIFACSKSQILAAAGCEALAAVDRTIILGNEGNAGGLAALCANGFEHLTGVAGIGGVGTGSLASITAALAANGLVLETLLSIESLLTGGESKLLATVLAYQRLVFVHWNFPLLIV